MCFLLKDYKNAKLKQYMMTDYIDFEKTPASIKHQYEKLKSKCEALEQENALLRMENKEYKSNKMNTKIEPKNTTGIYTADEELEAVLKAHGFIETSNKINRGKGKKTFKTSLSSKFEIYFNYENIEIFEGSACEEKRYSITENELKMLLLYFKFNPSQKKELFDGKHFTFKGMIEGMDYIKRELEGLTKFDAQPQRREKLGKIIDLYNTIEI